jgi:hypothetical protein
MTLPPRGAAVHARTASPRDIDGRLAGVDDADVVRLAALRVVYFRAASGEFYAHDAASAVDEPMEASSAFAATAGPAADELAFVAVHAPRLNARRNAVVRKLADLERDGAPPLERQCAAFRAVVRAFPRAFLSEVKPESLVTALVLFRKDAREPGVLTKLREMAESIFDDAMFTFVCVFLCALRVNAAVSLGPVRLWQCFAQTAFSTLNGHVMGALGSMRHVKKLLGMLNKFARSSWLQALLDKQAFACAFLVLTGAARHVFGDPLELVAATLGADAGASLRSAGASVQGAVDQATALATGVFATTAAAPSVIATTAPAPSVPATTAPAPAARRGPAPAPAPSTAPAPAARPTLARTAPAARPTLARTAGPMPAGTPDPLAWPVPETARAPEEGPTFMAGLVAAMSTGADTATIEAMTACVVATVEHVPTWLRAPLGISLAVVQLWRVVSDPRNVRTGAHVDPNAADKPTARHELRARFSGALETLKASDGTVRAVVEQIPERLAYYVLAAAIAYSAGDMSADRLLDALYLTRISFLGELLKCVLSPV